MYYGAPPANMTQGFPLAGCTLGWVPGSFIGSQVARVPALNMGWSGAHGMRTAARLWDRA